MLFYLQKENIYIEVEIKAQTVYFVKVMMSVLYDKMII